MATEKRPSRASVCKPIRASTPSRHRWSVGDGRRWGSTRSDGRAGPGSHVGRAPSRVSARQHRGNERRGASSPLPTALWAGIETPETTRAPQELFVPGRL